MTVQSEMTFQQLYADVNTFSEDAMRRAIEAAKRDPEVAARLVARIRADVNDPSADRERFETVAACIVLAEAQGAAAIPLLIEQATTDCGGYVHEACVYALNRLGAPAFAAAMDLITTEPDAGARVSCYEILWSARDEAGAATRQRVADFCAARLAVEPADAQRWGPAMAAASVLVLMQDPRVLPVLEERRKHAPSREAREGWTWLRNEFPAPARDGIEVDWRTDWPAQCREWAELMDPAREAEQIAKLQQIADLLEERASREEPVRPVVRAGPRVGRNDPCPCGSGKKYKKCCGG